MDRGESITDAKAFLQSLMRIEEKVREELRDDDWVNILEETDDKTSKRRSAYLLKYNTSLRKGLFQSKRDFDSEKDKIVDELKKLIKYTGRIYFYHKWEIVRIWQAQSSSCHII